MTPAKSLQFVKRSLDEGPAGLAVHPKKSLRGERPGGRLLLNGGSIEHLFTTEIHRGSATLRGGMGGAPDRR